MFLRASMYKNLKNSGPKMEPWGTPQVKWTAEDETFSRKVQQRMLYG